MSASVNINLSRMVDVRDLIARLQAERDAAIRRAEAAEADAAKWQQLWEELASAGERHMWREHGKLPPKGQRHE